MEEGTSGKRKTSEEQNGNSLEGNTESCKRHAPSQGEVGDGVPGTSGTWQATERPAKSCVHEVAIPEGFVSPKDEETYGSIRSPAYRGVPAKKYEFTLDPFQETAVACLERDESVVVSAHTSAGKTAVAEYAIAMAFRDKQRVIYTSPLKALSNQKYRELNEEFKDVGLMTGDVSLQPNASCIVMTTEILRSMLYRGSEVLREVAWVIFDEIHYMRDRERGVVWEESIIFLPDNVKMVFLSATISNASEFAEWVCHLHKQPCHVVYTDFRPTPLQHYAFPAGGQGLFLIVDDKGSFREENFHKLQLSLEKETQGQSNGGGGGRPSPGRGAGRGGRGGGGPGRGGGRGGRGAASGGPSDIYKIVKMIAERKFQPVIVFSFSRRECEQHAMAMAKLDFNTQEEKEMVEEVFGNAIKQCLTDEDQALTQVKTILPLLQRGIGVHHSGLLPILKEVIEILFSESLIKALFATETFAMGLNMPARTVVFTSVRKWDGEGHRWMASGEYIQMSGRAGRRGKDDRGIVIMMIDEKMDMEICKEMVLGKPAPLLSSYKLSYYTLLNLMSRTDSEYDTEYVIRHSFHQFQHEKALPQVMESISKIEEASASIHVEEESGLSEYNELRRTIAELERKLMAEILRPDRILPFLRPGRLVKVKDGADDWGWGVVVNVVRRKANPSALPSALVQTPPASAFVVDTLLQCATRASGGADGGRPRPSPPGTRGEMFVVPVQLTLVSGISTLRVAIPQDLRPPEARQSVLLALQDVQQRFPDGLPKLDPVEDIGIEDEAFEALLKTIAEEEGKLIAHPLFKAEGKQAAQAALQRKAELAAEAARMRMRMRDSQLHKFREELKNRSRVLRRLGHLSAEGVVQLKGRAACLIDTADELLLTELMLEGAFSKLDVHQMVAVMSCFVPVDKSNENVKLKAELERPLTLLKNTARKVAEVQKESKLEVDVEEYLESFQPYLMDVMYSWSKGATFSEVCELTDIFEGSIIRAARRLDELLNQLRAAAKAIGETELEKKFESGSESIRRGIMFANSLYI